MSVLLTVLDGDRLKCEEMTSSENNDVIDDLNDITQCSVCLRTFVDPRILPCIHTFCLRCLRQMGAKDDRPMTLLCPLCRQPFSLPENSFDALNKNFFMNKLIHTTKKLNLKEKITKRVECGITTACCSSNCQDGSCLTCSQQACGGEEDGDDEVSKYSQSEIDCNRHSTKLDVYCIDCQCLICLKCLIDGHKGHRGETAADAAAEFSREIENNVARLSSLRFLSRDLARHSEMQKQNMITELENTKMEIKKKSEEVRDLIDRHFKSLLEDFSTVEREKLKEAEIAKSEAERYEAMLSGLEGYCKEVLSKGSPMDVCQLKNRLSQRTKELEALYYRTEIFSTKLSFKATEYEEILQKQRNLIGEIEVETKTVDAFETSVVLVGCDGGRSTSTDLLKVNLCDDEPKVGFLDRRIPSTVRPEVAMATKCNMLYVCGVGEGANEIWRFHLVSGWSLCVSLTRGRIRHCVGCVGDSLYVCGGFSETDGKVLDSVEAFDVLSWRCLAVGQLASPVQNACCISYSQFLYVFCGLNQNNVTTGRVQVYDTATNVCRLLTRPIPNPFGPTKAWRAVAFGKLVLLFSRWTCFLFDVEAETWKEKENLRTEVDYFGLVRNDESIFVIGGGVDEVDDEGRWSWNCCDIIKRISFAETQQRVFSSRWKNVAKLPNKTLVHCCATLDFPSKEETDSAEAVG